MLNRRFIRFRVAALSVLSAMMIVSVLALPLGGVGRAAAQAVPPVPTASFTLNGFLRIKLTVAYAWLRSLPDSTSPSIDTAGRGEFVSVASPAPAWDGVQWWWAVRRGSGAVTGWVEQNSLEQAIAVTVTPATPSGQIPAANWNVGKPLVIALGVPFAWLRDSASSAGNARATVYQNIALIVRDATPIWDGVQWWWALNLPAFNTFGYIEQKSLRTLDSLSPTLTPSASAQPSADKAEWQAGTMLIVKTSLPFAWARAQASSSAGVLSTLQPGVQVKVSDAATWDGVQWWWPLATNYGQVLGWVEQNSLQIAPVPTSPTPTPPPATWGMSNVVRVKAAVTFVWLRGSPSSSGQVQSTQPSGSLFLIGGAPHWDGIQWWWLVQPAQGMSGWVEEHALELVSNNSNPSNVTTVPLPTPTQAG